MGAKPPSMARVLYVPSPPSRCKNDLASYGGAISYRASILGRAKDSRLHTGTQQDCSLPLRYDAFTPPAPLADIQPATLHHIWQPHTVSAPLFAPAIRPTA